MTKTIVGQLVNGKIIKLDIIDEWVGKEGHAEYLDCIDDPSPFHTIYFQKISLHGDECHSSEDHCLEHYMWLGEEEGWVAVPGT